MSVVEDFLGVRTVLTVLDSARSGRRYGCRVDVPKVETTGSLTVSSRLRVLYRQ